MNGLADVDGLKISIQVCVWLGCPPLRVLQISHLKEGNKDMCGSTAVT